MAVFYFRDVGMIVVKSVTETSIFYLHVQTCAVYYLYNWEWADYRHVMCCQGYKIYRI